MYSWNIFNSCLYTENLCSYCYSQLSIWSAACELLLASLSFPPHTPQLKCAQAVTTGVDKQYRNAQAALKEAESRLRQFLSCKAKTVDGNDDHSTWIPLEQTEDKDIQWLLETEKKVSPSKS